MKKNEFWSLFACVALALLVTWLQLIPGGQKYVYGLLILGALVLSYRIPAKSWLVMLLLVAGSPLLHVLKWIGVQLPSGEQFSWLKDVVLPVVMVLPSAFLGSAMGWMHNIVKDDF